MSLDDGMVFLLGPFVLADVRVQVIVPPLSALLANTSRQLLCDKAPVLRAMLKHKPQH